MSKCRVQTTEPLNAFEREKRAAVAARDIYGHGQRKPRPRPRTKTELDVLKERHQFVRSSDVDPSKLSWEDQLAAKYYDSLFKEFAIVNLKHWRSGQIGLRWRTEDEVLSGIGHLTCASMRCDFHQPSPRVVASLEEEHGGVIDPESTVPLVETRLEEAEMNFGYVEEGTKKNTLVKVVLCRECGKKLRRGRAKAKEERENQAVVETSSTTLRRAEQERVQSSDDDDCTPALPPDLERSRSTRRSASPDRRR
ncbi:FRA10AC1 family protein [Sporobolomyces koalae]|uniref:FRA10AC1 family protein n=1 Tax=Sporobolomyces koalae TaxID=500713 RepID=UPI0031781E7A